MNKEKINEMLRHVLLTLKSDKVFVPGEALEVLKMAIDELNSKPIMPKAFDAWYKNTALASDPDTPKFRIIHFQIMVMYGGIGVEEEMNLCDWISKGNEEYDEERFVRCIEAIIHGYEVEKNNE